MQLGSMIEPFMLDYTQAKTGHAITRRGLVIDHPTIPEFCCTLDGYRAHDDRVLENKFLGSFRHKEEFVPYYYPQALAQMRCVGASGCILHVGRGTSEPEEFDLTPKQGDPVAAAYEAEMWSRVEAFRLCLRTFTPPVPMPKAVTPEFFRTVDLRQEPLPNWGVVMLPTLQIFEETREAAEEHERSGKEAKALVPEDVAIVVSDRHRIGRAEASAAILRSGGETPHEPARRRRHPRRSRSRLGFCRRYDGAEAISEEQGRLLYRHQAGAAIQNG